MWAAQHSTTLGTLMVLTRIYCWVVMTALLFRHDLLSLFSLLFWLLGQRYVVKRILWWVSVGFSYCTWSSRLEKNKVAKTLQQN